LQYNIISIKRREASPTTAKMLYDLNIPCPPSTTPAALSRTLTFARSLGYTTVALNTTISMPISTIPPPPPLPSPSPSHQTAILRRATIPISDPSQNHKLSAVSALYDLVALRPTTERAFSAACTSLSDFSLISLDLTAFFPFHFPPRTCMAAVSRGIRFEICYAQAFSSDARSRSNFLANAAGLIRATRGRGIVVSSEAGSGLQLRAPADVVNLLAIWGLGPERGREGLEGLPRGVVVNEGLRRRGFRGVVDVLGGAGPERKKDDAEGGEKKKGKGMKEKGQQQQQQQGQKRRSEEGEGAQPDPNAPVSKRQAKKMKLAAGKGKPAAAES
jgi:ribonuclease P/MRP protein subunit RPP1